MTYTALQYMDADETIIQAQLIADSTAFVVLESGHDDYADAVAGTYGTVTAFDAGTYAEQLAEWRANAACDFLPFRDALEEVATTVIEDAEAWTTTNAPAGGFYGWVRRWNAGNRGARTETAMVQMAEYVYDEDIDNSRGNISEGTWEEWLDGLTLNGVSVWDNGSPPEDV